ncbi:hypothetical protein [Lutibacter sp.]|uniref:hypothetical protein n=1 Tax=Lutibacter sp. TaxID=1925666 RepID=UPI003568E2E9
MKKILTLFLIITLFSCNDGDLDVPSFDFEDTVNSCGEYVLYVENSSGTEVLAITLTNGELGTTVGEESYDTSTSLLVVYRIFDDEISSSYFCQDIPPTTPEVISSLDAESATINIVTTEIIEDSVVTGYSYEISISDLLFMDGDDRIYYESLDFGTFEVDL